MLQWAVEGRVNSKYFIECDKGYERNKVAMKNHQGSYLDAVPCLKQ